MEKKTNKRSKSIFSFLPPSKFLTSSTSRSSQSSETSSNNVDEKEGKDSKKNSRSSVYDNVNTMFVRLGQIESPIHLRRRLKAAFFNDYTQDGYDSDGVEVGQRNQLRDLRVSVNEYSYEFEDDISYSTVCEEEIEENPNTDFEYVNVDDDNDSTCDSDSDTDTDTNIFETIAGSSTPSEDLNNADDLIDENYDTFEENSISQVATISEDGGIAVDISSIREPFIRDFIKSHIVKDDEQTIHDVDTIRSTTYLPLERSSSCISPLEKADQSNEFSPSEKAYINASWKSFLKLIVNYIFNETSGILVHESDATYALYNRMLRRVGFSQESIEDLSGIFLSEEIKEKEVEDSGSTPLHVLNNSVVHNGSTDGSDSTEISNQYSFVIFKTGHNQMYYYNWNTDKIYRKMPIHMKGGKCPSNMDIIKYGIAKMRKQYDVKRVPLPKASLKKLHKHLSACIIQNSYRRFVYSTKVKHLRYNLLNGNINFFDSCNHQAFNEKSQNYFTLRLSSSLFAYSKSESEMTIERICQGIKFSRCIAYPFNDNISNNAFRSVKKSNYKGFSFKEYAPHIFSKLRSFWGIDQSDYQKELGSESISILSQNAGRSGSYFLMSESKKYMLKSMTVTEFRLLFNELLKDYTSHMIINRSSLLTRYLGLYLVKWQNMGRVHRVYFLAMNNVFEKGMPEEVYDLKGSTVNRTVLKHGESPRQGLVMKDNDLQQNLNLMRPLNVLLLSQLEDDSKWLSHHGIMDYSLLLGIHTVERDDDTNTEPLIDDRDLSDGQSIFTQHNGGVYSSFGENKQLYCKYYIGIIDMLQEYDVNKKLERGIKLTMLGMKKYQTGGISSMGPKAYQARFMQFVKNHVAVGRKDIAAFSKRKRQQNDEDI